MVATATDLCSLDRVRTELRLDPGDDEHDVMLVEHIGAAVAWVAKRVAYPIVDRDRTVGVYQPSNGHPLRLALRGLKAVGDIRYWTEHGDPETLPDGHLAAPEATQVKPMPQGDGLFVLPPVGGWPSFYGSTPLEVDVTLGLTLGRHPNEAALRQAVVLLVRELYDGGMMRSNMTLNSLLSPWCAKAPRLGQRDYVIHG